ncbi:MAG TPA: DUF1015 domain-containing protein, partial [Candidatus Limnocylindrales bacterium]
MPDIRPFRALRFDPEVVGDLGRVVAPPYDVIGPDLHTALLARSPRNAVRLDLPHEEPPEDPDERYRRVARTFAAWRSDGALRKDPRASLYVYEQVYRVPGTSLERTQRGFFARLRLEPFGPDGGVLPHERTLAGPREDRYRLLRATGVNTSPVVVLYRDPAASTRTDLAAIAAQTPVSDVTDDDGTRHRLWVVADDGPDGAVGRLVAAAGAGPVFIADGHHRYETALRYRDERRMTRSCEPDPPFDFIFALLLDADDELTVLPTHRVVRGLGDDGLAALLAGLDGLFEVMPAATDALVARYDAAGGLAGGEGPMGLVTRDGARQLVARRPAFETLVTGGEALRRLDVSLLGATLEALAGIDAAAVAG